MIYEIILISLLLVFSWTFGRCALHLVNAEKILNELSIAIGLSLVIIVVNFLYFIGDFRISSIRTILTVCFIFSLLYIVVSIWRGNKFCVTDLISTLIMYAILVLPAIIGGEQYYVFRGNWWDHFMYLCSAYGFSEFPLSSIINFEDKSILSNDLLVYAKSQYNLRPSVILLFSLFLSKGGGDIFLRSFLYNSAFLAAVYPPLKLIFRIIQNKMNSVTIPAWLLSLLPAGYVVGFWGQYAFDIQSWGQLASYNLLLAFVASVFMLFDRWHTSGGMANSPPPILNYSVSIIIYAGTWFIYPETALLYIVMLAVSSAVWLLLIRPSVTWRTICWIIALPLFSLIFALPNYETTIGFIIPQSSEGLTKANDWWNYFDTYLVGIGTDFEGTVNAIRLTIEKVYPLHDILSEFWTIPFFFIVSFFGFYFITPQGTSAVLYYPWLLLVIAFAITISWTFSRNVFLKFREAPLPILFIKVSCMTGLTLIAYLAIRGLWWSAGKALSFTSPCLYIILLLPLFYLPGTFDRSVTHVVTITVAWIVLTLSLGFGVARVYASMDENGIGYYQNYPSVQGKENKTGILWKFDVEEAQGCSGVNLNTISQPFFLLYAKLKLAYAGIPYFTRQPILTYMVVGNPIGVMPDIPTDCYASPVLENNRIVVSVRKVLR